MENRWCYQRLTIVKIWCPCLTLVSGTANVVNTPFNTSIASRIYRKGVLYDTDGL